MGHTLWLRFAASLFATLLQHGRSGPPRPHVLFLSQLEDHVALTAPQHGCPVCGKRLATSTDLARHYSELKNSHDVYTLSDVFCCGLR